MVTYGWFKGELAYLMIHQECSNDGVQFNHIS